MLKCDDCGRFCHMIIGAFCLNESLTDDLGIETETAH